MIVPIYYYILPAVCGGVKFAVLVKPSPFTAVLDVNMVEDIVSRIGYHRRQMKKIYRHYKYSETCLLSNVHINIDVTLPVPTLYSYTSQYLPSIATTVLILDTTVRILDTAK